MLSYWYLPKKTIMFLFLNIPLYLAKGGERRPPWTQDEGQQRGHEGHDAASGNQGQIWDQGQVQSQDQF